MDKHIFEKLVAQYEKSVCSANCLGSNFVEYKELNLEKSKVEKVKHIAQYLPQFHSIPENDKWWGKNFTEWNNVVKAVPQFAGHYQPHLPHDLGFYNLLDKSVIQQQIEIAQNYGLYGFCFYFYWFNSRRILEKPLDLFLKNRDLDMPFCLFWANQSWVRRWQGFSDFDHNDTLLLEQTHNEKDDEAVMKYLIDNCFNDPRYIKINGKPLFIVYYTHMFPNIEKTVKRWRMLVKNHYEDIHLAHVFMPSQHDLNPQEIGFDSQLQFPPIGCYQKKADIMKLNKDFNGQVYEYKSLVEFEKKREFNYFNKVIRSCFPSWDNEARRPGGAICYTNSTPQFFYEYVKAMNNYAIKNPVDKDESIVFINAWNEWAEGAHLEPDREYGYAWLEAIAKVIEERG